MKSSDFCYAENEYKYYDTYLGGEKFTGEEAVWYYEVNRFFTLLNVYKFPPFFLMPCKSFHKSCIAVFTSMSTADIGI